MDINFIMKRVINELGLDTLGLHEYYPDIYDNLKENTLHTFSQFFPYTYNVSLGLNQQIAYNDNTGARTYRISDPFLDALRTTILGVEEFGGDDIFGDYYRHTDYDVYDAMLGAQASNIASLGNYSYKSFKFIPPNKVVARGYGYVDYDVTIKIPNPNFGTLPDSVSIPFIKLARLDTQALLYPKLKHHENIETMDGNVDLKISDWADALDRRDDLIAEFRTTGFPNSAGYAPTYE